MAVITPQSDVYLLKVPLEIDNENQLTFATAAAQHTYFNSLPKIGYDDFTYIRKDGVLRIPAVMDDILSYNYVMYRNDAYSSKWFYAYITGMEYVNDSVTDVSIATDTFQTYQFELTYKKTFVEREHVNDDSVGLHTIPENLEMGNIGCIDRKSLKPSGTFRDYNGTTHSFLDGKECIVFLVSDWHPDLKPNNWYPLNARAFTGLGLFAVPDELGAAIVVKAYQRNQTDNEIVSMFMCPIKLFDNGYIEEKTTTVDGITAHVNIMTQSAISQVGLINLLSTPNYEVPLPATLYGNYSPRNNKLKVYPYNFIAVSNTVGEMEEYHYEDFNNNTPKFKMLGALSQGCAIKLTPQSYNKSTIVAQDTAEYAVNARKYPVCAWASDSYTNWLTQNSVNNGISIAGSVATGAAMAAFGNPFGLVGSAIQIAGSIGNIVQASKMPNRTKGDIGMGDWAEASGECYVIYQYSIRPEYASVLDSYFDAYGYKVNEVKVPNITGRRNWNYVKTVGCYIEADIPQDDLQQIKDMFNRGITFWHNPATFADYSQNNDII